MGGLHRPNRAPELLFVVSGSALDFFEKYNASIHRCQLIAYQFRYGSIGRLVVFKLGASNSLPTPIERDLTIGSARAWIR